MKTLLKVLGVVAAIGLLGGVMAYLAGSFETKISVQPHRAPPQASQAGAVDVVLVKEPVIERATGTLRAKVETVISPLIAATISSVSVWAGDEVQQGDVLVQLDSRELEARLDQQRHGLVSAEATLLRAKQDFERVQRILKADPGAVSGAELDRTEAALQSARAEALSAQRLVDEARTGLSYSTITAPISGRIVDRYADPGDTARPGEPLLRMYDPQNLRLEASVRESIASALVRGQRLSVFVDALDKELPATVDEIVPSADPGSRSFLVKASLEETPGLYPGMFGRLLIPIGETDRIYIPLSAVTQIGQLDFVEVLTDEGPIRRFVRLGRFGSDSRVQVISGLTPGERVQLGREGL